MEATKQKTRLLRSSSCPRVSIRRKDSFNKIRLLFENNCKTSETNRHSFTVIKNKSKQLADPPNCDSLNVIEEREGTAHNGDHSSSEPQEVILRNNNSFERNENKFTPNLMDLKVCDSVKNKVNYFETNLNKDNKSKRIAKAAKESEFCNNLQESHGNKDNQGKSYAPKDFKRDKATNESILLLENNETYLNSSSDLRQTVTQFADFETNITSVSSLTPEVQYRRTDLKNSEDFKIKPIPKQRTSLIKSSGEHEKQDKEWFKVNQTSNQITERMSVQSEDSGVSDLSNNNSFLWKPNPSPNREKDKTNCAGANQTLLDEYQCIQTDEHIYEELINRSFSPNEWIDIENEDKRQTQTTKSDSNRRSQNFRSNNNYRKSFRPKLHKRKHNKSHPSISTSLKSSEQSSDSGSATEYEDIDEDESDHGYADPFKQQLNKITEQQVIRQNSDHIYELFDTEEVQLRDSRQTLDIKSKLDSVLSGERTANTDQQNGSELAPILNKSRNECEPNIYTSTPRRSESNSMGRPNQRADSILSRNSSIYVNPNYFHSDYTNDLTSGLSLNDKTQLSSQSFINSNVASYLELNFIRREDQCSSFMGEPLYQFYQKDVRRRAELWIHFDHNISGLDYDDYENNSIYGITSYNSSKPSMATNKSKDQLNCDRIHTLCKRNLSAAMDLVGYGPNRSLWSQLPQVVNSKDNLLSTLSVKVKRLQESMFEIISSEASYSKSLNILVTHFYNCIELSENNPQILDLREKKSLFSNIADIFKISSNLLKALEKRFEQNILLYDICDIIYEFAVNQFQPYIHYCAYQRDQEKLLTRLTQSRIPFIDVLQRLESNQICQNQTLLSFLMLPMQRITRYPLLIDAVAQQLPPESPLLDSVHKTLGFVNQLVRKCNEETKKVQRMQELIEIEKSLHFRSKMKSYPIVSGARYLVKKGSVLRLSPQLSSKRTIGKSTLKWTKSSIHLFLFSDLLILAKKKSENNYSVFDYCSRSTVQLVSLDELGPIPNPKVMVPRNHRNLAQLILLHNHESKLAEYTISFELESEKLRWTEAVSQPSSENPNEVIYEEWDCPQVQCIKSYSARQTDEITLEETDVLNVFRKMKDGWFEGQRIRDGVKGWFPSDCTEEIINQHVRSRNMKLRHRLLMYTQSGIQEQISQRKEPAVPSIAIQV